jgi:CRISPR-associated endoribonuclease Cas6
VEVDLKRAMHFRKTPETISKIIGEIISTEDKNYVFSNLGKADKDGFYKGKGKFFIRSFEEETVFEIFNNLEGYENDFLRIKQMDMSAFSFRPVKGIITYSPVFIKIKDFFWTFLKDGNVEKFKKAIQLDLIEKYEKITGEKMEKEDFFAELFTIKNEKPFTYWYGGLKFFGYKIFLIPKEDESSQKLAFTALGLGMGHKNKEVGGGFCNPVKNILV